MVGVLPEEFRYLDEGVDLWLPLKPASEQGDHDLTVTARLSADVKPEEAEKSLQELTLPCGHGVDVVPLRDAMSDS